MTESDVHRRLAAILAADVVGYSKLMGQDEAGTLTAVRELRTEVLEPKISEYQGRLFKVMGDGFLVEFASVVNAVTCALAIQKCLAPENNSPLHERQIMLRIGIHLGDVIAEGGDLFGDGVNVAARIEGLAPAGGIAVSSMVYDNIGNRLDVGFEDMGEQKLKNIARAMRVYRLNIGNPPSASGTLERQAEPSIAVLPFTVLSNDQDQEYFADGLVEDLITTLSKISGLKVIARNSTFTYKGKAVDIRSVAKELGVSYVLEGSIRTSGNRIRITAQLIDAADGSHLWAERFDRPMNDIFALQDEMTLVLATEMQVKLTEGEQARLHYTTTSNVEAWTHWVKGLHYFRQAVTKENTANVLACWRKALELDPNSSTLHAMAGFVHYIDARFGWWDDFDTASSKALVRAQRALELDADNPHAQLTTSFALLLQRDYADCAIHARRAAELAPSSADVASFACFCLAFAGYPGEAIRLGERSMTLSPRCPPYYFGHLGNAYRLAGSYEQAMTNFKMYHSLIPGFGLVDLVLALFESGRNDEAFKTAQELLIIRPDFSIAKWARSQFRADADRFSADQAALSACGLPLG